MKKVKKFILRCFNAANSCLRSLCEKANWSTKLYDKVIMPAVVDVLFLNNRWLGKKLYYGFFLRTDNVTKTCLTEEQRNNRKEYDRICKDVMKSWLIFDIAPIEYFLYQFEKRDYWQRNEFLPDNHRWNVLHERFGPEVKKDHGDKWRFYQMAKPYFKRDACHVGGDAPKEDYLAFVAKHPKFFVKELEGCFGKNAYLLDTKSDEEREEVYQKLITHGEWILEELIIQSEEMARWNDTSVNSVRMPSFITKDGTHHLVEPFFRAGRKGEIVDNAMNGGVVAGVDEKTGIFITDGFDEFGRHFEKHPTSGHPIKGWQVPKWDELCRLTEEIHRSMPPYHRYVALDFALTDDGWVLVEANWGQLSFCQAGAQRGVKKLFYEYIQ